MDILKEFKVSYYPSEKEASDALEILWATREELDTLDMHPLAQKTVQQAFEIARRLGFF